MNDLKDILDSLAEKRKYRSLDREKVGKIFSQVKLSEPTESFDLERVRRRIKNDMAAGKKPALLSRPLRLSLAAAAMATFLVTAFLLSDFFTVPGPVATANLVRGEAFIESEGGRKSLSGTMTAGRGEKIITAPGSAADLAFGSQVRLRAGSATEINVRNYRRREGSVDLALFVPRGEVTVAVKKLTGDDRVAIATPGSLAIVRGTLFTVTVAPDGSSRIILLEGKVQVSPIVPGISIQDVEEGGVPAAILEKGEYCSIPSPDGTGLSTTSPIVPMPTAGKNFPELKNISAFVEKPDSLEGKEASSAGEKPEEPVSLPAYDRGKSRYVYTLAAGRRLLKVRSDNVVMTSAAHRVIWKRAVKADLDAAPLVKRRSIVVVQEKGRLAAFSRKDGSLLWRTGLDGSPVTLLSSDGDSLLAATEDRGLFKIGNRGNLIWKNSTESICRGKAVIAGSLYFLTLSDGTLLGLDAQRGIKVIRRKFEGGVSHVSAFGKRLYLVLSTGKLLAFDFESDESLWQVSLPETPVKSSVADTRGLYLFLSDGTALFVTFEGETAWKRETGGPFVAPPVLKGPHIHILGKEIFLLLDRQTGNVVWSVVVPQVTGNNLVLSGKKVLFFTGEKGLQSLKK